MGFRTYTPMKPPALDPADPASSPHPAPLGRARCRCCKSSPSPPPPGAVGVDGLSGKSLGILGYFTQKERTTASIWWSVVKQWQTTCCLCNRTQESAHFRYSAHRPILRACGAAEVLAAQTTPKEPMPKGSEIMP